MLKEKKVIDQDSEGEEAEEGGEVEEEEVTEEEGEVDQDVLIEIEEMMIEEVETVTTVRVMEEEKVITRMFKIFRGIMKTDLTPLIDMRVCNFVYFNYVLLLIKQIN